MVKDLTTKTMSDQKDHLITVLTETVETYKQRVEQLEAEAGYNEAKIRALEDEKQRIRVVLTESQELIHNQVVEIEKYNKELDLATRWNELFKSAKNRIKLENQRLRSQINDLMLDRNEAYLEINKLQSESLLQFIKRKLNGLKRK